MNTATLETLCRKLLVCSLVALGISYFQKDILPEPSFYSTDIQQAPKQTDTLKRPFQVSVKDQTYTIKPKYDYELHGMVVSYHHSDSFADIYHADWEDHLNTKDICVIWGENVTSAIYKKLDFKNTTWTCWVSWDDHATGKQFKGNQLSNNHLLVHDSYISKQVRAAQPGDQIYLRGILAEYENPSNGFTRGTSTSRTDTGNGACETIYLDEFSVVKQANTGWRSVYDLAKIVAIVSLIGNILMMGIAPVRR